MFYSSSLSDVSHALPFSESQKSNQTSEISRSEPNEQFASELSEADDSSQTHDASALEPGPAKETLQEEGDETLVNDEFQSEWLPCSVEEFCDSQE